MNERWIEHKFTALESEPLFPQPAGRITTKRKPPKNIGRTQCPDCGKTVCLYVMTSRHGSARVIGYRRHWRRRYGSSTFLCPRSDTPKDQ